MLNEEEKKSFKQALCLYLGKYNAVRELRIVQISEMSFNQSGSDFGVDYFDLHFKMSPIEYVEYADDIDIIQSNLLSSSQLFLRNLGNVSLSNVYVSPKLTGSVAKDKISSDEKERASRLLNQAKAILISVSTGGPRIQEKNDEYIDLKRKIDKIYSNLGIDNTGLFDDLWQWYGVWSSGPYPSYQSRRVYIAELITGLVSKIESLEIQELPEVDLTGAQRLDRTIREIRFRYFEAHNEEQFQAIGILCREALITLAQEAFVPEKYIQYCDVPPSSTDTKRMLDAFIQGELSSSVNEILRKFARAANDLANELTHKRTATQKDAAICINATFSVVNIVFALMNKVENSSL